MQQWSVTASVLFLSTKTSTHTKKKEPTNERVRLFQTHGNGNYEITQLSDSRLCRSNKSIIERDRSPGAIDERNVFSLHSKSTPVHWTCVVCSDVTVISLTVYSWRRVAVSVCRCVRVCWCVCVRNEGRTASRTMRWRRRWWTTSITDLSRAIFPL